MLCWVVKRICRKKLYVQKMNKEWKRSTNYSSWAQQLSQWLEGYKSLWLKSEFNVLESTLPKSYLSLSKENYNIHPWSSTNPHRKKLRYIFFSRAHTLPETNGSPLKIGLLPKRKLSHSNHPFFSFKIMVQWKIGVSPIISCNFSNTFPLELPRIYG